METSIVLTLKQLIIAAAVLIVVCSGVLCRVYVRLLIRQRVMLRRLRTLFHGRLDELERRMWVLRLQSGLFSPMEADEPEPQAPVETPYTQAIRMVQDGADALMVAQTCGLCKGEAGLIVSLYRKDTDTT